jgi:hypothetical protein
LWQIYGAIDVSESEGEATPSGRSERAADVAAKAERVKLPAVVLRKLPVFMTLNGGCVPLRGAIGTPSAGGAYSDVSELDDSLRDVLGDELLSYSTDDEVSLLQLAEWPRATPTDFVRFLSTRLRTPAASSGSSRSSATTPSPPLLLPLQPILLLLSAAGSPKEVKLHPAERDELIRRLTQVRWLPTEHRTIVAALL